MTNRLAATTSPYLLQHAENPVDWREFGPEAFAEARNRDVPVLLSVGYSACHWCHVMAHESFEDPRVGEYINRHFVALKVDREQRPDVDSTYMVATQLLAREGGWPMTVFLTPEGQAFHAGTYFPPQPSRGRPSFMQVLRAVQDAWSQRRDQVQQSAAQVTQALAGHTEAVESMLAVEVPLSDNTYVFRNLLEQWLDSLEIVRDTPYEGFGQGAKFPPSPLLEALWAIAASNVQASSHRAPIAEERPRGAQQSDSHNCAPSEMSVEGRAEELLDATLDALVTGALQDHVGGGFFRYSVTRDWGLPHYEKMLYDNAQLLRVLALETHRLESLGTDTVRAARYRHAAKSTAEWLLREMLTDQGVFASSLDADSDPDTPAAPREGAYYTFSPAMKRGGSQEPVSAQPAQPAQLAQPVPVTAQWGETERGSGILDECLHSQLWTVRQQRPAPGRDDKVVTGWNGMAVEALAQAGVLLAQPAWIDCARRAARYVWEAHRLQETGLLIRTSRDGRLDRHVGTLEDHVRMGLGMLMIYRATGEPEWYRRSQELAQTTLTHFVKGGVTREVAHPDPILTSAGFSGVADPFDDVAASAPAMLARWLLELGADEISGVTVGSVVDHLIEPVRGLVARAAQSAGGSVVATLLRENPQTIVYVAGDDAVGMSQVRQILGPRAVLDVLALDDHERLGVVPNPLNTPQSKGQPRDGWSVRICMDGVCEMPIHDTAALLARLTQEIRPHQRG